MSRFITKFQTMSRRRRAATVLTAVAVLAVMVAIFLFSAEGKTESGGRSGRVTGFLVTLIYGPGLTAEQHAAYVTQWGYAVRKLAHMTEYAALTAILTAHLICARPLRIRPRQWTEWVFPFLFCAVYASSDEIHQIFSHRGPAVTDVMIDCAGGLIGLCLLHLAAFAVSQCRSRLHAKSAETRQGGQSCN